MQRDARRPYAVVFSTANENLALHADFHMLYDHASFMIEIDG